MAATPAYDTPWAKTGGWEDDEGLEDYLNQTAAPQPWSRGQNGKGLILPDRSVKVWQTNELGEPHHDDIGSPYLAKLDVFPSGATTVMSPDEENLFGIDRPTAEQIVEREGPRHGLFHLRSFTSQRLAGGQPGRVDSQPDPHAVWTEISRREIKPLRAQRAASHRLAAEGAVKTGSDEMAHEHARIARGSCPTCGDPLGGEHGTFCPRCQWSENDANLDSDPLSNPPDPTVDFHRGIQAHRIAPSHRWAKWLVAVNDEG